MGLLNWKLRYRDFDGWTMDEFVDVAGKTLAELGLGTRDTPNERLVRFYAGEGAMTKPTREGREARYSYRHLVEFLVTRRLIEDGWPLAKIADLMGTSDVAYLESMLPDGPAVPTAAQREVARLKRSTRLRDDNMSVAVLAPSMDEEELSIDRGPALASSGAIASARMLERQSELTSSRHAVARLLSFLGLHDHKPAWRQRLEIELTPWCRVTVDASKLDALDGAACDLAGRALTQVLRERRFARRTVK
jgi:hypothetical protein